MKRSKHTRIRCYFDYLVSGFLDICFAYALYRIVPLVQLMVKMNLCIAGQNFVAWAQCGLDPAITRTRGFNHLPLGLHWLLLRGGKKGWGTQ